MKKLNPKGFSAPHILLLLVIVGLIGGTGYYVYSSQKKTNESLDNAAKSQSDPQKTEKKIAEKPVAEPDPTADWTSYSSEKGKFSLKYPAAWVQPVNKETCNPGLFDRALYLGPDAASVLKCGSEYFGLMSFSSVDGDKQTNYDLGTTYKDIVTKEVTVGNVKGKRISGAAKAPASEDPYTQLEGTIEIHYVFFTNNVTYVATYTQTPGSPVSSDVLKDFDLIVTKTLKFN